MRQPGSAMKPIVYLAAFRHGDFTLETLVPDEPISVPNGRPDAPKWISNYDGRFKGLIPIREALAESRNAVAIWITEQIGIDAVLRTSRSLGVQTPLQRYATTALGASEVNLLELATAYRTIASGVLAQPYVIEQIVRDSGDVVDGREHRSLPVAMDDGALALIQEGLRGVVRIPTGTAHALDSRGFPIAVMGKTGTTNEFRDALFVGSTYGVDGITVAVRIGFDDNRSLGAEGNRRASGAAGVSGTDAEGVSRRHRGPGAGVSGSDGSQHHSLLAGRRAGAYRASAAVRWRNSHRHSRDGIVNGTALKQVAQAFRPADRRG